MNIMREVNDELIVVKYGSTSVTGEYTSIEQLNANIKRYSADLAQYAGRLLVVSSGAVFCGRILASRAGRIIEDEAILATTGNPMLFRLWQESFSTHGLLSSQILPTHRELQIEEERVRLKEVLARSISASVIPIVNENDALSDEELKKLVYGGDNDGLAAEVARLIGSRRLILFTDVDGFEVDGRVQERLSLSECEGLASYANGSNRGGGMITKLNAALGFVKSGEGKVVHIARAGTPIDDVLNCRAGTVIAA